MKQIEKSSLSRSLRILMVVCGVGILCCAFILFADSREYAEGDAAYRQVRLMADFANSRGDKERHKVDFAGLKQTNPDVVAWLTSEDSEIDYPVVQGRDNDYYLRHMFTGGRNKLGTIFMDYRNSSEFLDRNTIIYGHNMRDGSMFASLEEYKDQSYYESFPRMILYTPNGNFRIELFAGFLVDGSNEAIPTEFMDDGDYLSYIASCREESFFESDTIVQADDAIITLCTCSYEFDNARLALVGKLTPVLR